MAYRCRCLNISAPSGTPRLVRENYHMAEAVEPNGDAVRQLVGELERYAGWLGRDAQAARIRTSVRGLARAVNKGEDPVNSFRMVQAHLNRWGSGGG